MMHLAARKLVMTGFFLISILLLQQVTAKEWKANWITANQNQNASNTWIAFRKDFVIGKSPGRALARIAADTKYWLWINGKLIVFEGGLKRGPNPNDTYFDEIDIGPYLEKGKNTIAILLWYFGKDGFSHHSSGKAALLFDCQAPGFILLSDKDWKASVDGAYQTCGSPFPNFRLSESSILYDANTAHENWQLPNYDSGWLEPAVVLGKAGIAPWNQLVPRSIPFWKDYGLKNYVKLAVHRDNLNYRDTIIGYLPYDAQVTPSLEFEAQAGKHIVIFTDNYLFYNGGATNIRGEYITRQGYQTYESMGWMSGQKVYYIIPRGVKVRSLKFRETGYNADFTGSFSCQDDLLNRFWKKAARTLYVDMRDNFMDCPERERAQWAGDAVIESGMAFYALSGSGDMLVKKWLHEIAGWQQTDGSIISPVPEGNYAYELPDQVLAAGGYYGVWNYYINTGDLQTIKDLYPAIKKYLSIWKIDKNGLVQLRNGNWNWGDWGDNKDMLLIYNLWYYLAVKSQYLIASELHNTNDAAFYLGFMTRFEKAFNMHFWNKQLKGYRDPGYAGRTDDRVQALAVVAGIADKTKYPVLLNIFKREMHASPYMEKYVFEAMMQMGYPDEAIKRQKLRFKNMVYNSNFTTLFEGWGIGKEGFGGGGVNHAWSGGGLTVLSQYLCGVSPVKPGYKAFKILPVPGHLQYANVVVPTKNGLISSGFKNTLSGFELDCTVPANTKAIAGIPLRKYSFIKVNGKVVLQNGKYTVLSSVFYPVISAGYVEFLLPAGNYAIKGVL